MNRPGILAALNRSGVKLRSQANYVQYCWGYVPGLRFVSAVDDALMSFFIV